MLLFILLIHISLILPSRISKIYIIKNLQQLFAIMLWCY